MYLPTTDGEKTLSGGQVDGRSASGGKEGNLQIRLNATDDMDSIFFIQLVADVQTHYAEILNASGRP
jgi:hypothetical protein